ncbi:MAG: TIGR02099 family protein [Rhodoferax sp.]|nr:TIGR02099 family protein [Rhodoferax sp.]
MNELTPATSPTRLLRSLAFVARWLLALLLLAWLLLAASWGTLHLVIVPRIGELRPQLEAAATRMAGMPVRIESITAYSTSLLPAFELGNVRLLDAQGREALRLPRILVSLSPRALLKRTFDQVLVDSPVLDVRRTADGRIRVAGLDLAQGQGAEPDDAMLDRIFSQPEFVIRGGSVVWTDEMRDMPPLALQSVDMVLRNRSRVHEIRLDATPPASWGDRFQVMARFEQPFLSVGNGRWQEWTGQVYADFARVDVARLKQYADPGVDIDQGRGALRAWLDVERGRLSGVTADLSLGQVAVRLAPDLQPLQLATMSGRLSGRLGDETREFATRDLAFQTQDGIRWPGGNLSLKQTLANAQRPASGDLQADQLDLSALAQIATRLPLDAQWHQALARHRPSGLVESVRVQWQEPGAGKAVTYQADGRVQRLSLRSVPDTSGAPAGSTRSIGTPGVQGLGLVFSLNESGGKASLEMTDGGVDLPGIFQETLVPFKRLSGDLSWQLRGEAMQVQLSRLQFSNADTEGALELQWQTSDPARSQSRSRFPGLLDMQGRLSRANGARVFRYLPLVMEPEARNYVRDAVQAGVASDVRFKVKGDLWDVPFPEGTQGEFLITAQVSGATLAYVPRSLQTADSRPWPVATRLSGELVIDRQSLKVRGARASLAGSPALQITRADAVIADLANSVVAVDLEARGPLPELLGFANSSPVGELTDQALARVVATGPAELRLKLEVPVDAVDRTRVQGSVQLQGNDLQIAPDLPRLARARGMVGFTEGGFSVTGVQAGMLGGEVRIDGGSQAGAGAPAMQFRLKGTASAEGLRQARTWGMVPRLARQLSGSASYDASIGLRGGEPEISITSSLAGMALNLPAPLGKPAEQALALRLESAPLQADAADGAGRPRDQLLLELGRVVSVRYQRDTSGAQPRVLRGAIVVGPGDADAAALPRDGVTALVRVDTVDVDAWERLAAQVVGDGPASGGPAGAAQPYWPTSVAVRAGSFTAGGRTLSDLVAGGSRDGAVWRVNLDARELNGYAEYRPPANQGAGRLYARLSRLTLAPSVASDVESLLDEQPQSIPALDIVVEELDLRGRKLGRVEVDAVNRAVAGGGASGREWRLNRFDVISPEAVFRATGNWVPLQAQSATASSRRRTVMNFQLDIQNAGGLLARFGMQDLVRRGKGLMQGQVAWVGSPLSLDYATLAGNFNVNVENGQFLKADPGLAKLLGVLSLQSLPRRLVLDFRDVFSEGFVFDFFRGDVRIDQGVAYSSNLQMKGVNAAVLMEGQADLFRETQDIRVVVVPEINAGTASLIAAAINPAVGLGSFLAQFVLRKPLMEAATQEFHIDGSWVEPRIQRVGGKSSADGKTDPAPATAPAR